jgi:hypothetical protein
VNAFGHPLPYPETGSTEAGHTPFLVEVMGGGMLGVDAGSTICGYKIAGIGHGVHMRLVTYPDPAVSYWAGCGLCAASAVIQGKMYRLDTAIA